MQQVLLETLSLDSQTGVVSGTPEEITTSDFIEFQANDGQLDSNVSRIDFNIQERGSLVVNTTRGADVYDGRTSLVDAIVFAAETPGSTPTITFDLPEGDRVITLDNRLYLAQRTISIIGPTNGEGVTIRRIPGPNAQVFRIFEIYSSTVHLANLTITGGDAGYGSEGVGGGVYGSYSFLTLENCTITGNKAFQGGGIWSNRGDKRLAAKLTNCTITDNTATGYDIYNGSGGGIQVSDSGIELESCTVVGNHGKSGGGAGISIGADTDSSVQMNNSIVAGNLEATSDAPASDIDFLGDGDRWTSFISDGHNLIGDGNAANYFKSSGDKINLVDSELKIEPLADRGGPTPTLAIRSNSPAYNAGQAAARVDQRGEPRGAHGADDIGAFELQDSERPYIFSVSLTPDTPLTDDPLTAVAIADDPNGTPVTLSYAWFRTRGGKTTELPETGSRLQTVGDIVALGDVIKVTVVANNGTFDSAPQSASVTIGNTPISIATFTLQPKTPYTFEKMIATVKTADADKTRPFYSYTWTKNGAVMQTLAHSRSSQDFYDLNLKGRGDKGDIITVTVTVSDDESTAMAQGTATVRNSVPVLSKLSLTPQAPLSGQVVTSTYGGRDADGDALTKIYSWKIGKKLLAGEKGSRLDLVKYPHVKAGDIITLEMRLSDGESLSKTMSASVTVAAQSASVKSVSMRPEPSAKAS